MGGAEEGLAKQRNIQPSRSTMTRLYFLCPNTRRWFSTTFEKVPSDGSIRGLFQVHCRYCESVHQYKGDEVRRSRPASQPNPNLGQKAKPKVFRVSTRPLSFASPKLKDPCYWSLSEADQKRADEAQLASTLFMLFSHFRSSLAYWKVVGLGNLCLSFPPAFRLDKVD
jgi:hypothetical protein